MDDPLLRNLVWIFVVLLVVLRLINNLFKAGYFGLGSIAMISVGEKVKTLNSRLHRYMDHPLRLSSSAQTFDKLTLFVLMAMFIFLDPSPFYLAAFFAYLILFDIVIPLVVASFNAEILVIRLFPFLRWGYDLISPLPYLLTLLAKQNRRRELEQESQSDDLDDIQAFIRAGTEEGIIEEDDKSLFTNLFNFRETLVREVMTPRTEIVSVEVNSSRQDILDLFKSSKHSRIPVYNKDLDHIEGFLRFKDVLELYESKQEIRSFLKQPLLVPEDRYISELMTEMLKNRSQLAIVIDEYGGTSGLLTLENLIEELVGDIREEHEGEAEETNHATEDGSYVIEGKMLLEDFSEQFGLTVESDTVDTVGGYIFYSEGQIPKVGQIVKIEEVEIEILEADDRRIYKCRVLPKTQMEESPEGEGHSP